MNLIQAQAALQVAELRYNADPSEENAQALENAQKNYLDIPNEGADVTTKTDADAKAKAVADKKK